MADPKSELEKLAASLGAKGVTAAAPASPLGIFGGGLSTAAETGNTGLDFDALFKEQKNNDSDEGGGSGGGSGGGRAAAPALPKTYSETTKSVDLTSPITARKLLRQAIQERIGRAPTAAEFQTFIAALNKAERDNPTVRTTKYELNDTTRQYGVDKQTTKGGIDAPGFVEEYAEDNPQFKKEHGAYQAASTFFNALLQAIGAPTD